MINARMKLHKYYTLGEVDAYGVPQIPSIQDTPKGEIKIAINTFSVNNYTDIKFRDCTYIGLTLAEVQDNYVIRYGDVLLKVLYINPDGRFKQVYLKEI